MPKLLAIDDDRSALELVRHAFAGSPFEILTAGSVGEGLRMVRPDIDVVLLDIQLPDISGLEAARKFQAIDPKLPLIFVTGMGSSDTAIEAMKLGAYDYLLKPIDLPKLRTLVERAVEIRRLMNVRVDFASDGAPQPEHSQFLGRSPLMQDVFKSIGRVASQNITVLIIGESGTGKELVARAIYHHSQRAGKPFLAINCAAIPENLLESELFGHEKGSFTSADSRRIGKFEQLSGGTILLDEVGDMSPLVQSKVLRLLQEQRFERVGGTQTIQTDVRVIAAANRDLKRLASEGQFREDLYYRLAGYTIQLPPLRERGDDILVLLRYSLQRFGREFGKDVRDFSPEALELLVNYSWPGNVRELEAVVRHALLQSAGTVILPEFLPDSVRFAARAIQLSPEAGAGFDLPAFVADRLQSSTENLYAEAVEMLDRHVLAIVLRHSQGNQSRAAKILGITRGSLRKKIKTLRLEIGPVSDAEDAIPLESDSDVAVLPESAPS